MFKKYAQFHGVASRSEYWWWTLFATVVGYSIVGLDVAINGQSTNFPLVWSLGTLLPSLAVTVRRFRDAGYGWGSLFLALLPILGAIIIIVMLCQPSEVKATADSARDRVHDPR
ncbi:DUF805 domain-containing protein [Cryobacterium sp. HLT2-28]|uniref:DUF805 domain-containing protein n=1 Tax=Cryobacterium sp. HLT2-28 TaxID=1259146 RepID=UPI003518D21F